MKPCHRFQPAKNWISPVDERCMLDDARNANRLSRSIIAPIAAKEAATALVGLK